MWRSTTQTSCRIKCACSLAGKRLKLPSRCQLCTKAEAPPAPPPLPPPKKSGRRFLKFLAGTVLVTGGTMVGAVAYARANPEFRKQVESNWPILIGFSPYLFNDDDDEDKKVMEVLPGLRGGGFSNLPSLLFPKPKDDEPDLVSESAAATAVTDTPASSDMILSQQVDTQKEEEARKKEEEARQKAEDLRQKEEELRQKEESRLERLRREREEEQRAKELQNKIIEQEIDDAADLAAYEAIIDATANISSQLTHDAIKAQKTAALRTTEHRERLKEAMDESQSDTKDKRDQWGRVVEAAEAKIQALKVADDYSQAARMELEKLQVVINESKEIKSKLPSSQIVTDATKHLNDMTYDLDSATAEVVKAQSESNILKEFHELIQESKEQFTKELESLMPEVKLGEKDNKLTEDELNSLIAYGHRRIEQLQHQLAELLTMEQQHIEKALEKQKIELQQETVEAINRELERQNGVFTMEIQKKIDQAKQESEKEMRTQLRRQAAAHSDHLSDVLRQQVKEFEVELQKHEREIRIQEQDNYHQKLAGSLATLKGVQAAVEGRASMEKQVKKAQELWLASETLKRTIESGNGTPTPLANEVVAVLDASEGNSFVGDIVKSIPETALTKGIHSQETLRQRWDHVKRVCRRVSMVEESGSGLFTYVVSFFQSLLVLSEKLVPPPHPDQEVEPDSLDTFKILDYATYHMEQGDLEQAVRYVNQLKGMPRKVVADWLEQARLLLETSQAATVLSAHASASGLGGLNF
ncbi:MICOS complex subunit Mic60-like isoform X2 [Asterias amurensis]|uniref:MICOS complex subunit Mic60-like isoform X1 n=1 Tax=Asterias amurensis TaxID=7602 RepID=UPI003AB51D11